AEFHQDVGTVMDIPWFGTRDWETMYDPPAYRTSKQHLSINKIWEICETWHKIENNNKAADQAIGLVLLNPDPKDPTDPHLGRDNTKAEKYFAHVPAPGDTAGRRPAAELALKELADSGMLETPKPVDANGNADPDEVRQHAAALKAQHNLRQVLDQNT